MTFQPKDGADFALYRRFPIQRAHEISESEQARLLGLINASHTRRPFAAEELFIFPGVLSTQAIDSYGTRMGASSLRNYLVDVQAGIGLMNSHRTGGWNDAELPVGRIFSGALEGQALATGQVPFDDQMGQALAIWAYMVRGIQITPDATNDDLILGIESGTVNDLSITFSIRPDGRYVCSICGENYLDYEACRHFAFAEYEAGRCFAWVENAHAYEGSLVWAGATPGAMIRKAQMGAQRGLLDKAQVDFLENHYQMRLLDTRTSEPLKKLDAPARAEETEVSMNREPVLTQLAEYGVGEDQLAELRAVEDDGAFVGQAVSQLGQRLTDAEAQARELETEAAMGRTYRDDLVEATVQARVRAQGDAFDAARYQQFLAGSNDVAFIREARDTWESLAEQILSGGTGQTRKPKTDTPVRAPAAAYR